MRLGPIQFAVRVWIARAQRGEQSLSPGHGGGGLLAPAAFLRGRCACRLALDDFGLHFGRVYLRR